MSNKREFEERLAVQLRSSEEQLDTESCLRLKAMRQEVLKAAGSGFSANKPSQWWSPDNWTSFGRRWESALVVVGVMVIAVLLSLPEQSPGVMDPDNNMAIEEGAHEDPEFYGSLEFYQWLAEQEQAG